MSLLARTWHRRQRLTVCYTDPAGRRWHWPHEVTAWLGIGLEWKPQDCWIGLFWRTDRVVGGTVSEYDLVRRDWWLCLLPCLPIHVWARWAAPPRPAPF